MELFYLAVFDVKDKLSHGGIQLARSPRMAQPSEK
jgi:hypothetical protein